jgi:hypothetical protein
MRAPKGLQTNRLLDKLDGPLLPFLSATPDERGTLLSQLYAEKSGADFKPGAARFEALLEPTQLSGPVPDAIRRTFLELSQLRNCLVHRSGVADSRLIEKCPWLGLSAGQRIRLSAADFRRFYLGALSYVLLLDHRYVAVWNQPDPRHVKDGYGRSLSMLQARMSDVSDG